MQFRTGADHLDLLHHTDYPDEINDRIIFKDCKKIIPPLNHEHACLENYPVIINIKRHYNKKYVHTITKLGIKLKDRTIKLGDIINHSVTKAYENETYKGYPRAILTTADHSVREEGVPLAKINDNYKKIKELYMLNIKNKYAIGKHNEEINIFNYIFNLCFS